MTARQLIRERCNRAAFVALGCLALLGLFQFTGAPIAAGWIAVPCMMGFVASGIYTQTVIDCPKCHVIFGQFVWSVAYPGLSLASPRFCPHCALELDADWDKGVRPVSPFMP